jgi:hypothetical protein
MQLFRVRLELGSASASPWQADTLFGHLCWSIVRHRGEAALEALLAATATRLPRSSASVVTAPAKLCAAATCASCRPF